jgi:hypothetical protein
MVTALRAHVCALQGSLVWIVRWLAVAADMVPAMTLGLVSATKDGERTIAQRSKCVLIQAVQAMAPVAMVSALAPLGSLALLAPSPMVDVIPLVVLMVHAILCHINVNVQQGPVAQHACQWFRLARITAISVGFA